MQQLVQPELKQDQSETPSEAIASLASRQSDDVDGLLEAIELHESIVEHFPGGLCAFDKNLKMTVCNQRLKQLLDYPDELFANGYPTIEQLFRLKAERGEYGPGDVEKHVQSRLRLVSQGQSHRYERTLPDGRIIDVRGRPLSKGGFVTTYMDVTEQRKNVTRTDALIESFHGGLGVFDNNLNMILCNEFLRSRIPNSEELFSSGLPSLESYVWHNAKYGEYGEGPIAHLALKRLQAIRSGELIQHDVIVDGNQCFAVKCAPTKQGGYVETQVNVTQERLRSTQLEVVLRNFPGGVAMFDGSMNAVLYNGQFKQLLDLPDEMFSSSPLSLENLLRYNALAGELGEGDVDELVASRLEAIRENSTYSLDRKTAAGVDLEIKGVPLEDGGLLAIYADVTERNEKQAESIRLANYNVLTGLPNRALFRDRLDIALAQAERGISMALFYLDICRFRRINEIYGQRVGDQILAVLGERFAENKRGTDTYAYLGGDLFAIIQVGIHDLSGAEALATRVLRIVREPIEFEGAIFELDACIGIAFAPDNGTFADVIDTKANAALNSAKDIGAGMFMFYESCVNRLQL